MKSCKILLIESEEVESKNIIRLMMESASYSFQFAQTQTLTTALDILENESFDLIMMNLMLPDSGGIYGLNKVVEKGLKSPVIVVNGPNDDNLFESAILSGAQDYLSKTTIGVHSLRRSAIAALLRSERQKKNAEIETNKNHSNQISSLAEMARDVAGNIETPLQSMKQTLADLRGITERREELSAKEVKSILSEAEHISDDFSTILTDLKSFWKDLALDPLFRSRAKSDYRILCVDDEPEILDIMVEALHSYGYAHVDRASNGVEAYNTAVTSVKEGNQYSCIIADWKMPKMTGLDLLEKIRSNHYLRDLAFIMVSALDDRERVEQAVLFGVNDYCIKPFERDEIPRRVDRLRLTHKH